MRAIPFVAKDIGDAVAQIRTELGTEAVVLSVRQVAPQGLARLWQKPRIEVLAGLPDPTPPAPPTPPTRVVEEAAPPSQPSPGPTVSARQALQRYQHQTAAEPEAAPEREIGLTALEAEPTTDLRSPWRSAAVLQRLGLLPLQAHRVLERMQELHGEGALPPDSLARELAITRAALLSFWRAAPAPRTADHGVFHVFVGPAGSGKSTVLCKWLAQSVLMEGSTARVWRLDERTANTSEMVSLYGEILGVPVHRHWGKPAGAVEGERRWVDLPGVDFQETGAVAGLRPSLERFGPAQIHLVLNAAYTTPLLLAQVRAFSVLPITDLILTHLDEETAWGKLWNLVVGTNYTLRFLSAGQNIPGRFSPAVPEQLSSSLFGGKSGAAG